MIYRNNALPDTAPLTFESSDAVKTRIENLFESEVASLIENLKKIDHVSTSLKVISMEKIRFLGMTVHWIEPETFEPAARILCVKRLNPHITGEQFASMVSSINQRFDIQNKVVGIVVSNKIDSEQVFKSHGITFHENPNDNLINGIANDESMDIPDELNEEVPLVQCDFQAKCLENRTLPGQYQSACELLHAVLVTDANQAMKNPTYANIFRSTMQKLNHLFRLSNWTVAREAMKTTYQISIEPPTPTQWQSFYYSIQTVVQHDMTVINSVMVAFNAPEFTVDEFEFLNEYLSVVGPISEALDNLQSNGLYAVLLPTLKTLRDCLQPSQYQNGLRFCVSLAEAIHFGFIERFNDFFDMANEKCVCATIAACTHPFFKLRWIDADTIDQSYFDKITDLIVSAAAKCITNATQHPANQSQTSK